MIKSDKFCIYPSKEYKPYLNVLQNDLFIAN